MTTKPRSPNRIALVIGNANYQFAHKLKTTHADAEAISSALSDVGFSSHVRDSVGTFLALKPYFDQSQAAINKLLSNFYIAAQTADMAIVYFSGHGIELNSTNYLIPIEAELNNIVDVQFQAIPLPNVIGTVTGAATIKLVILDACRDNPFSDMTGIIKYKSSQTGLAPPNPRGGASVFYAAAAGRKAIEGPEGGLSPFAAALSVHLRDSSLDLYYILGKIASQVGETTGFAQEPTLYGPPMPKVTLAGDPSSGTDQIATEPPRPFTAPLRPPIRPPFDPVEPAIIPSPDKPANALRFRILALLMLSLPLVAAGWWWISSPSPPPFPEPEFVIRKSAAFGGNGGDPFDDTTANPKRLPISKIDVGVTLNPANRNQKLIGRLQVHWANTPGLLHGGGPLEVQANPAVFEKDEAITRLFIFHMDYTWARNEAAPHWISGLQIHTNKTFYNFGDTNGVGNICLVSAGENIIGFYGRAGSYLDQIGCVFAKAK